jgi:hypothetical protein
LTHVLAAAITAASEFEHLTDCYILKLPGQLSVYASSAVARNELTYSELPNCLWKSSARLLGDEDDVGIWRCWLCVTCATTLTGALTAAVLAGGNAEFAGVEVGFRVDQVECTVRPFDGVAALQRAVADGGAFLVGGEEGGLVEAGPQGFALGGEGFDAVESG